MNAWQIWLEDLFLRGENKLTISGTHDHTGYGIEADMAFKSHSGKECWIREAYGNSLEEVMDALFVGVVQP